MWHYPDGSRVLELSTKTTPDDAFRLARGYGRSSATTASSSRAPSRRRPARRSSSSRRRARGDRGSGDACRSRRSCLGGSGGRSARAFAAGGGDDDPRAGAEVKRECRGYTCLDGDVVGEGARERPRREAARARRRQRSRAMAAGPQGARCRSASRMPSTVLEALAGCPGSGRSGAARRRGAPACLGPTTSTAARVHKTRRRFTGRGCRVELTTLTVGERTWTRSQSNPRIPRASRRSSSRLGFSLQPNVSMARGLKELIGFGRPRYAVIDVGTNSVKLHVGRTTAARAAGRPRRPLGDHAPRRGPRRDGRAPAGADAADVEAIAGHGGRGEALGATEIVAVGTAGMRLASNRDAFVEAVRARHGRRDRGDLGRGGEPARLPRGRRQASGSARAASSSSIRVAAARSSRSGRGDRVDERFSVDVGAVRFTERFGLDSAVSEDVVASAQAAIAENLASLDGRARPDALVALGGVVTNLAAVKHDLATYNSDVVQGTVLAASRGRPPDRALPDADGRRAARGRRAPAEARRGRARRRVHRARGDGEARQRFARGERPRAPPRGAPRPVRQLISRAASPLRRPTAQARASASSGSS